MPEHRPEAEASNINLPNILLALFKRKRLLLFCTLGGLLAAAGVYFLWPRTYESDAILLVRYVLDRSAVDPETTAAGAVGSIATKTNDTFINAEVAILKSWDLAVQVAEALGPKRVLPDAKGSSSVTQAAGAIYSGLDVESSKNSNVIQVSYSNSRPEVATLVLNELVNRYFTKHLEVHRSAGAFDFVSQQADQVRARLNQTEDALRSLKAKAGVLDLKDSTLGLTNEASRIEDQLRTAEGDLAEQRAKVKLMENATGVTTSNAPLPSPTATAQPTGSAVASASPNPAVEPSPATAQPTTEQIRQYQGVITRLGELRKSELELLSKYSESTSLVKSVRAQIADLDREKSESEKKFPSLAAMGSPKTDLSSERAKLAGVEAKTETLRNQFARVQERIKQLADTSPQIANLERNKDLEEANYKYFEGSLEKARVDEALDPSKMPNISAVQRPSPPSLVTKLRDKVTLILGVGGLFLGLGLALGTELFISRTIKRPIDLERQLRTSVFLSIPYKAGKERLRLPKKAVGRNGKQAGSTNGKTEVAPWDPGHFIKPYSAAIRDRLGLYFELQGISHKPKLVGVTGFHEGAGSSTLAASLAASLSETGEGKVLLVDANVPDGGAHQFFDGRPAVALKGALESSEPATPAADNLYLATIAPPNAHPARVGLKKFFSLMPNLKASEFDYVTFDLPPLNQTSPTIGLAGYMDKVLLVVEAEKNSRELVQRGYRELMGARADVSIVLNKVRSYLPKWLDGDN